MADEEGKNVNEGNEESKSLKEGVSENKVLKEMGSEAKVLKERASENKVLKEVDSEIKVLKEGGSETVVKEGSFASKDNIASEGNVIEEVVEEEQEKQEKTSGEGTEEVAEEESATKVALPPPLYEVRPPLGDKFQAENVRDIILLTMSEQLTNRPYRADMAPKFCRMIANGVRQRVQELNMKRYKLVVSSTIIEMKGAGVKCVQRCIWDPETDDYADNMYRSETLYCYTVVYGIYMY